MASGLSIVTTPLKDGSSTEVSALRTEVSELVITPALRQTDDGTLTFTGHLQLVHLPTGRMIANGTSCPRLQDLANRLAAFGWGFTDAGHYAAAVNKDERDRIVAVIREWEMAAADDGPVGYSGESDEKIAARQAAPAATMLREHIASFIDTENRRRDLKWEDSKELWMASVAYCCEAYGVVYLLAVLRSIDPAVADIAARDLVGAWDCGDSLGEWVYQWGEELAAGKPLTLHGIPTADPLADLS